MSEKLPEESKKDLSDFQKKLVEDRKHAQESPEPEISDTGFQRMNGPIGVELSEDEWKAIKVASITDKITRKE